MRRHRVHVLPLVLCLSSGDLLNIFTHVEDRKVHLCVCVESRKLGIVSKAVSGRQGAQASLDLCENRWAVEPDSFGGFVSDFLHHGFLSVFLLFWLERRLQDQCVPADVRCEGDVDALRSSALGIDLDRVTEVNQYVELEVLRLSVDARRRDDDILECFLDSCLDLWARGELLGFVDHHHDVAVDLRLCQLPAHARLDAFFLLGGVVQAIDCCLEILELFPMCLDFFELVFASPHVAVNAEHLCEIDPTVLVALQLLNVHCTVTCKHVLHG
mmetsp:Transcript_55215/g.139462  ORF Transcript_55215/g.139462 Transcript_55215/m.139462 type:complete len:271 (-) Transcript_55215:1090-1902(-)